MDELLDRLEAFYVMTQAAAMLGTQNSELFDRDAQMLIDFLGQVYGWSRELTDAAADMILGDMMRIGLAEDYRAMASAEMLEECVKKHLIFYEIKGRVLEAMAHSDRSNSWQDTKVAQEIRNSLGFDFFHHLYEPHAQYAHLKARADGGEPAASVQTALMLLLGIGCERNIAYAQRLLERALLWGERTGAKILAFLWAQEGNRKMESFYEAVFTYLYEAVDLSELLPAEKAENTVAAEYCTLIAAIRSLVIQSSGRQGVDVMFADLINREDISFPDKLSLIRRYRDGTWLKACPAKREPVKIGFLY